MGWIYDPLRHANVNTETGEVVTDLMAALQQQQMNAQEHMAALTGLGQAGLSGLIGGLSYANTGGSYTTSNTIYFGAGQAYVPNVYAPSEPIAAKPDDEFTWLRKRVDDVCWKEAA